MSEPAVSFVVLSYNYARYIGDCIASILNQQGDHDLEVIVVDDASTDNSDDVIRSFHDARIRYIRHPENLGHGATVTDGLRAARGRLVARIDSDDRYRSEFLNEMVPLFDEHPDIGLAYADVAIIDDAGKQNVDHVDVVHGGRDFHGWEYVQLLEENFICAPTIIARREEWLHALPVPSWLVFHDWYFTLKMARRRPFYFRSRVLADYRVHGTNYHTVISRNKSEEASIFGFLDELYAIPEDDSQLEAEKQAARRRIYGRHYLQLAQKYFWFRHNADARRCYLRAVRNRPELLARPEVLRQLAATIAGRGAYDAVNRMMKRS